MLRISVKLTAGHCCGRYDFAANNPDRSAITSSSGIRKKRRAGPESELGANKLSSELRLAGAESSAARWWGKEFQKIVELENALDAKEATTALLKAVIPNLGTLLVYIVITRLIAEAAASPSLSAPNVGQLLGFFSAFGTFIGAAAGFSGLLIGAFDMPVIYERARPIVETATETAELKEEAGDLNGHIQLDRVSTATHQNYLWCLMVSAWKSVPGNKWPSSALRIGEVHIGAPTSGICKPRKR